MTRYAPPRFAPISQVGTRPLAPERALLHPLWLVAVTVLLVNDHLLKGAEVLPMALTGKLSDFAGLLVAPVVLCAVARVRSRALIAAAHVLIGAVFAGINISPAFAGAFEGLMALTPTPWSIFVDPTDVVALPMLLVSWRVLVPAMGREVSSPVFAQSIALGVGALACMATSPPPPNPPPTVTPPGEFTPWIWGNIGVANDSDESMVLRVRRLKETVFLDCGLVLANPEHALSRELFGPAEVWIVEPGRISPLESWRAWDGGTCDAFLVDGSDLPMRVVALDLEEYWSAEFPSTTDAADESRTIHAGSAEGGWDDHPVLHPAPGLLEPLAAPGCEIPDESLGLAWSELPAQGWWTLEGVTVAPDGCVALDLEASGAQTRWFLCIPAGAFPFELGEDILISPLQLGHSLQSIDGVELATDAERLRVARGEDTVVIGLQATELRQIADCNLSHDACGSLVRPLELVVDTGAGAPETVRAGESLTVGEGETVFLVRAMDIPLGDGACLPDDLPSTRLVETVFVRMAPDTPEAPRTDSDESQE